MPGIDINYFMRQATKLTQQIEERKKKLAEETVEGRAGDGRVTVIANGLQEIKTIKVDQAIVDPNDIAMLEDLVTAAVNAALKASKEHHDRELAKISGGVKIPGLM